MFTGGDTLTGAAFFGGAMTITALFTRGWSSASTDTLLYAATFGIGMA